MKWISLIGLLVCGSVNAQSVICERYGALPGEPQQTFDRRCPGGYTCKEVREITASHAQDVKQKISAPQKMETVLEAMVERCGKGDVPECPIIEELFGS